MIWLIALALGLPMTFFVLAFVVGCFERNPVRTFIPAQPPADVGPYVKAMLQRAATLGFIWRGHGVHIKYREKLQAELLQSADRLMLAIVSQGRIAGMPSKKTILLGQFDDGTTLITVDEAGIAELDQRTRRQIVMNGDFEELVRKHYQALQGAPQMAIPFAADADWSTVDEIYRGRADRIVGRGLAKYIDAEREVFRYTPLGSFRAVFVHAFGQLLRPSNYWRNYKPRPG